MKTLSPLKAIRAKCLECAGRPSEVRKCEVLDCPLFIYRFGRNPNRRGIGNRAIGVYSKKRSSVGQNSLRTGNSGADVKIDLI